MEKEWISAAELERRFERTRKIEIYDCVGSTNAVLRDAALNGAAEGTLVLARTQTAGRGRLGRSFFSPEGGLYFSLLLRPDNEPQNSVYITVAAAVSVARVLEHVSGKKCLIKWVNDIYIDGKKVCGILTQGVFGGQSDRLDSVILGIGINLNAPREGYPDYIADRAAAVFNSNTLDPKQTAKITAEIINEFEKLYSGLNELEFIEEYRRRSYLDGMTVSYEADGMEYTARVKGIDERARLVLEKNGKLITISAGDVSVKPVTEKKDG